MGKRFSKDVFTGTCCKTRTQRVGRRERERERERERGEGRGGGGGRRSVRVCVGGKGNGGDVGGRIGGDFAEVGGVNTACRPAR